jgi:hypothetical protein
MEETHDEMRTLWCDNAWWFCFKSGRVNRLERVFVVIEPARDVVEISSRFQKGQ